MEIEDRGICIRNVHRMGSENEGVGQLVNLYFIRSPSELWLLKWSIIRVIKTEGV